MSQLLSVLFSQFYLLLTVMVLRCCAGFFSSSSEWGPLSSCGAWASQRAGFSHCRALLQALGAADVGSVAVAPGLQDTGSVVVVHRLSLSTAHGIFPDQGLNPSLLRWQAASLSLSHQGGPGVLFNKQSSVKHGKQLLVKVSS